MKAAHLWVIVSAVWLPQCALAHTHLLRSTPAENAVLEKSPPAAILAFAEPVTLTAIRLESADGSKRAVKPLPAKPAAELSAALPNLVPGRYKLSWRALSDDGHVMSGEIHFSVGGKSGQ